MSKAMVCVHCMRRGMNGVPSVAIYGGESICNGDLIRVLFNERHAKEKT